MTFNLAIKYTARTIAWGALAAGGLFGAWAFILVAWAATGGAA